MKNKHKATLCGNRWFLISVLLLDSRFYNFVKFRGKFNKKYLICKVLVHDHRTMKCWTRTHPPPPNTHTDTWIPTTILLSNFIFHFTWTNKLSLLKEKVGLSTCHLAGIPTLKHVTFFSFHRHPMLPLSMESLVVTFPINSTESLSIWFTPLSIYKCTQTHRKHLFRLNALAFGKLWLKSADSHQLFSPF